MQTKAKYKTTAGQTPTLCSGSAAGGSGGDARRNQPNSPSRARKGLMASQMGPIRPVSSTSAAQNRIQVMYSAGLLVGVLEPNQPVIITPSRYRTPNAPQIALNQATPGSPRRARSSQRGYFTAPSPTLSPANMATRTNETTTTAAAENKYRARESGRS